MPDDDFGDDGGVWEPVRFPVLGVCLAVVLVPAGCYAALRAVSAWMTGY